MLRIAVSVFAVSMLYLGAGIIFSKAQAQDKTFPVGVPVQAQALFCKTLEDAKLIANLKGEESPEVVALLISGQCQQLSGVAVYVKEVYRVGDWAVWELTSGNIPSFYEATDWKGIAPIPKGQTDT